MVYYEQSLQVERQKKEQADNGTNKVLEGAFHFYYYYIMNINCVSKFSLWKSLWRGMIFYGTVITNVITSAHPTKAKTCLFYPSFWSHTEHFQMLQD